MSISEPRYLEVLAHVRYWEDATVNGQEDTDGTRIPFRVGDDWNPIIDLTSGQIEGWPLGMTADIHYKICDAGEYWLLNEDKVRIAQWNGDYVPNDYLCHGKEGYSDYIIFSVGKDGRITGYKKPEMGFPAAGILWYDTGDWQLL